MDAGSSSPRQTVRASSVHDHRGSGTNAGASTPAGGNGKKPMLLNRSAEEMRRNGLNMEKMIKKNVLASSRPGSLKRGLAVVEYFKAKNKQHDAGDASSSSSSAAAAASDDAQGALKRTKMSPPPPPVATKSVSFSMPSESTSDGAAPNTAAAESLSASVSSPSPRRSIDHNAPRTNLLLSAKATAAGVQPLDDRAFAPRGPPSITRLSQQLTSPLRHRNSPVRSRIQAMTEETMRRISETSSASAAAAAAAAANGTGTSTANRGVLTAALEQIDVALPVRTSTAKSPFQSFQSKFTGQAQRSPARAASLSTLLASPMATPQLARQLPPRSGPAVVDLSHSSTEKSPGTPLRASASASNASTTRSPKPIVAPPKPVRSLFGSRTAVATKSLCFSTEGVATSLDVTPDGEIIIVGFTDGSVRLYEMDSTVPSDRHGYLLGHMDEESSQSAANANVRVKITSDGRYVFVGCRTGPRIVMSINLHNYRNEKENDDEDFEHLQKYFHTSPRLRGFADVTKYVPPSGKASNRNAYYLLTGLGVGNLNVWRFEEPPVLDPHAEPTWNYLYTFTANGNTAIVAEFLTGAAVTGDSSSSSSVLGIAATCEDKNLRVWELEAPAPVASSSASGTDTGDDDDDMFHGPVHVVKSHRDIPNTKDIAAIYGAYAYGISATGEAYRILIRDPSARHTFELEKLDGGNSSKSRRSMILLESVYASDDGNVLIAVSTEGIFYYSNHVGSNGDKPSYLRIIGRNASLHPQYKTPMKVYTPTAAAATQSVPAPNALEPMMVVVTNPQTDDDDDDDGYLNVDQTENFAARWLVPSRGRDCWVCGVRNVTHWQAPSEHQQQKAAAAQHETNQRKERLAKRRTSADAPHGKKSPASTPLASPTRAKAKAKAKKTGTPIVQVASTPKTGALLTPQSTSGSGGGGALAVASSPSVSRGKPPSGSSSKHARQRIDVDDDDGGSSNHSTSGTGASVSDLSDELERYKERYNKIVMEWQRRLKGERQMRRLWKTRETEFNTELDETLEKLYVAEQELTALKEQHKDAEKRYSFEKLKAEQQSSVKVRYEQLCEQMQEKLTHVDDQKRVLEQTTRTLLQEVDRNVRSLKSSALLERNECVVCKDKEANTAIIPCGHLVFCEEDGDVYQRSAPANHVMCPVCQREVISLLRIYS